MIESTSPAAKVFSVPLVVVNVAVVPPAAIETEPIDEPFFWTSNTVVAVALADAAKYEPAKFAAKLTARAIGMRTTLALAVGMPG